MKKDSRSRIAWGHHVLVAILFFATIISFLAFTSENQTRILSQNQTYAHDAALQAASRVEDMLEARLTSLNLLSIAVAETIQKPWIEQDFLKLWSTFTRLFDIRAKSSAC